MIDFMSDMMIAIGNDFVWVNPSGSTTNDSSTLSPSAAVAAEVAGGEAPATATGGSAAGAPAAGAGTAAAGSGAFSTSCVGFSGGSSLISQVLRMNLQLVECTTLSSSHHMKQKQWQALYRFSMSGQAVGLI